jgi:hypothetical protein
MATITVPFNKLGGLFRKYGTAQRAETSAGLLEVAKRAQVIITSATRYAPPASANGGIGAVNYELYLRAWSVKRALLNGNRGVLVANTKPYAPNVEYGRKAGAKAPPLKAITRWAQKKLSLPYDEAKKAAWPIRSAIARRGLRPRGVLQGPSTTKDFLDAMEDSMSKALSRATKKACV